MTMGAVVGGSSSFTGAGVGEVMMQGATPQGTPASLMSVTQQLAAPSVPAMNAQLSPPQRPQLTAQQTSPDCQPAMPFSHVDDSLRIVEKIIKRKVKRKRK